MVLWGNINTSNEFSVNMINDTMKYAKVLQEYKKNVLDVYLLLQNHSPSFIQRLVS